VFVVTLTTPFNDNVAEHIRRRLYLSADATCNSSAGESPAVVTNL
jgi:hypothetical protein